MPLNLVTGPANAGKARFVLDAVRARVEDDPLLVVPTVHDAEAYRRELAEGGTVFGPRVTVFDGLIAEMAHRAGSAEEALGPAQRDRLLAAAIAGAELEVLAASAGSPGFVTAVGALVAELQRELVTPQRFAQAMTAWGVAHGRGGRTPGRWRRCTAGTASCSMAWAGSTASCGHGGRWRPCARRPRQWDGTPVFLYGFDDLTRLQREVVETLAEREDVDVTVALTWEAALGPGRAGIHVPGARTPGRPPRGPAGSLRVLRESGTAPPRARAVRGRGRPDRSGGCACGCWRRAASAPRSSWSPPRWSP